MMVQSNGRANRVKIGPGPHYVYIVAGLEIAKIGHSNNPRSRLGSIRTGSADPLDLVHTWSLPKAAAIEMEARMHTLFKWCRASGEWFKIDWHIIRQIGDLDIANDHALRDDLLSDLATWWRLRGDDHAGSIEAFKSAHRRGLVQNNEWDSVFLE